ncbi:uncharacterized protein LOC103937519 isoform X2 [Pyrus x bretschneideri]|uniref:uncharacterized protein LOC103937519 isoform X2 n=1 Tax=Pyrus x bretschneideri TaxID=225117 RepID=UPI0020307E97|nr:uncharacterized protein LOC103937519 isoform X2 [Pyrus x bretschneideri]
MCLACRVRNTDSDCLLQWRPNRKIFRPTIRSSRPPQMKRLGVTSRSKLCSELRTRKRVTTFIRVCWECRKDPASAPTNSVDRTVWTFGRKATIELTHNWGTESDPEFKGYHNGNSEPRCFGHIGITVDDTYKVCERFGSLGVEFVKKPDDGKMKGLDFKTFGLLAYRILCIGSLTMLIC